MSEIRIQKLKDILLELRHLDGNVPPFEALKITPSQYVYIDKLHHVGPCKLQTLAQDLGLTPPTVSVMIKGLERKALVIRNVDVTDRRSFIFKLTRNGQSVYTKVDNFRCNKVATLLAHINEEEQELLLKLLEKTIKTKKE